MTPSESVLAPPPGPATTEPQATETVQIGASLPPDQRQSTAADLLQFVGTWQGDDIEECLDIVYATRSVWYP